MEEYKHIIEMEEKLNKYNAILEKFISVLNEFDDYQVEYEKIKAYYMSEQFFKDVKKYNMGELPKDLKCGVLSEDAIFEMIGDNYQIAISMLEISTKIIKKH